MYSSSQNLSQVFLFYSRCQFHIIVSTGFIFISDSSESTHTGLTGAFPPVISTRADADTDSRHRAA